MNPMQSSSIAPKQNALAPNLSDRDLSSHMAPVHGDGGLHVEFFYSRVKLKTLDPELNGKFETRLCIAKQPLGDRYTVACGEISDEQAAREFPQQYAYFKQYEDVPSTGTPLAELPGITQSQIAMMVIHGLRSVEDLVQIGEGQASQIGMEITHARQLAVKWLDNKEANADTIDAADLEANLKARMDDQQRQIDALTTRNMQLEAENSAVQRLSAGDGGSAGAMAQAGAPGPQPMAVDDGVSHDYDDGDAFMGGGDVATGTDDLSESDPLAGG